MSDTCILYLNDTINELITSAKNTKKINDFESGILMGYYNSISLLLSQATAFGITQKLDKEIQEFVPESLLIS